MTGTDIVYSSASLDERKSYAAAIARAGDLLPKSLWENVMIDGRMVQRPSAGKVLLIAETGNMLGIHPIAALNGVNVIEGKPTVAPALMRALIQRAGHKVRVRKQGTIEGGDFAVTVEIIRSDDPDHPFTSTWTPHRGARAGLCAYVFDDKSKTWQVRARSKSGNPLPWENYPESLCLARATREVANEGASDVIMGVYTPEELGGHVNEAGELLDLTATTVDRTPPRRAPEPEPTGEPEVIDAEVAEETAAQEPTAPEPVEPATVLTPRAWDPVPWEDAVAGAHTIEQLRKVHADADERGVLMQPISNGEPLGVFLRKVKARMEQDAAATEATE